MREDDGLSGLKEQFPCSPARGAERALPFTFMSLLVLNSASPAPLIPSSLHFPSRAVFSLYSPWDAGCPLEMEWTLNRTHLTGFCFLFLSIGFEELKVFSGFFSPLLSWWWWQKKGRRPCKMVLFHIQQGLFHTQTDFSDAEDEHLNIYGGTYWYCPTERKIWKSPTTHFARNSCQSWLEMELIYSKDL